MKTVIWKFPLTGTRSEIEMPKEAKILHIDTQNSQGCIWAACNPEADRETRIFQIVGTGEGFHDDCGSAYLGTFLSGPFVWHVFEVL